MRFEAHHEVLLNRIEPAFDRAVDSTLQVARLEAQRYTKTGKFAKSLDRAGTEHVGDQLRTSIGSPLVSAHVKEKGGFMRAHGTGYMMIPQQDGSFRKVKSVRVRATPVVTVAGPQFPRLLLEELQRDR